VPSTLRYHRHCPQNAVVFRHFCGARGRLCGVDHAHGPSVRVAPRFAPPRPPLFAAIVITLLFIHPVRTQRWIDHHFPREHLDPDFLQEAAGGFAHLNEASAHQNQPPGATPTHELEQVERGEGHGRNSSGTQEKAFVHRNQSQDAGYVMKPFGNCPRSLPSEPVDIRLVVEGALSANKDLLEKHAIAVSLQLPADLPGRVRTPQTVEIVFINLMKNRERLQRLAS